MGTITRHKCRDYFKGKSDTSPVFSYLELSTLDFDNVEITEPDNYRKILNFYITLFLPGQGVSSVKLNLAPWGDLVKRYKDVANQFKQFLKDLYPDFKTLEEELGQYLYIGITTTGSPSKKKFYYQNVIATPPKLNTAADIDKRLQEHQDKEKKMQEDAAEAAKAEDGTEVKLEDKKLKQITDDTEVKVVSRDLRITPFSTESFELLDIPEEFEKWLDQATALFSYNGIKTPQGIYEAFIAYGGQDIRDENTFGEVPSHVPDTANDLDKLLAKLRRRYIPFDALIFYRVRFLQAQPEAGEPINQYLIRLRKFARPCQWGALHDALILTVMIIHMKDKGLQVRAMMENYTLNQLVSKKAAKEFSEKQVQYINSSNGNGLATIGRVQNNSSNKTCFGCGRAWPHTGDCPAKGKKCYKCDGMNHFAKYCKSKNKDGEQSKKKKDDQPQGNKKKKGKGKFKNKKSIKKAAAGEDTEDEDDETSEDSDGSFSK